MLRSVRLNNPTPFGNTNFCKTNTNTCIVLPVIIKIEQPINMLTNWPCFLIRMFFVKTLTVCKTISKLFSNLASTEK